MVCQNLLGNISLFPRTTAFFVVFSFSWCNWSWKACNFQVLLVHSSRQAYVTYVALGFSEFDRRNICRKQTLQFLLPKLKDRITPHVTNFFRLRLTIEEQEGKRKYKSDGAVMVGEFVCMYVCSCTVSE